MLGVVLSRSNADVRALAALVLTAASFSSSRACESCLPSLPSAVGVPVKLDTRTPSSAGIRSARSYISSSHTTSRFDHPSMALRRAAAGAPWATFSARAVFSSLSAATRASPSLTFR